jgi:hypothetical protein
MSSPQQLLTPVAIQAKLANIARLDNNIASMLVAVHRERAELSNLLMASAYTTTLAQPKPHTTADDNTQPPAKPEPVAVPEFSGGVEENTANYTNSHSSSDCGSETSNEHTDMQREQQIQDLLDCYDHQQPGLVGSAGALDILNAVVRDTSASIECMEPVSKRGCFFYSPSALTIDIKASNAILSILEKNFPPIYGSRWRDERRKMLNRKNVDAYRQKHATLCKERAKKYRQKRKSSSKPTPFNTLS